MDSNIIEEIREQLVAVGFLIEGELIKGDITSAPTKDDAVGWYWIKDHYYEYSVNDDGKPVKITFNDGETLSSQKELDWEYPTDAPVSSRPRLYGNVLLAGNVTVISAPGGVGKSVFALVMACSLAEGEDLMELGTINKPRKVSYLTTEDQSAEVQLRLQAIRKHYRISANNNLRFHAHFNMKLCMEVEGQVAATGFYDLVNKSCKDCDVLIIDPLVGFHDADENSNKLMEQVMTHLRGIARANTAAILCVHHTKKGAITGEPDNNSRGASAVINAARVSMGLARMTEQEANQFVVADDVWPHIIRLDYGKSNYAPRVADARWYGLKNIALDALDWETGEKCMEYVGVPAPEVLQLKDKKADGWNLERVMHAVLTAGISSPFKLTGESKEILQKALSDTDKPIGKSALHERFSYFPAKGDTPRQVPVFRTVYKCWIEKGARNVTFYHFKEKTS